MIRSLCLAGLGLAGCVIDSKVDEIDLGHLTRQVIVDTATWDLTDAETMPSVECASSPDVCGGQVELWCAAEDVCNAECGGQTCEVVVLIALWNTVNLSQERTELVTLEGQPLENVTIDEVTFTVIDNTLNVPSPELTVSVGPAGVMTASGAQTVGVIPPVPMGDEVSEQQIQLAPDGQAVLASRMRTYQTPFNLVVGSTVELRAGDTIPRGRLVAELGIDARAATGL
jgi:hypothetical protein